MSQSNNYKILIAEDEVPLRKALVSKLTKEGFITLEAEDGRQALNVSLELHPDLIITDIFMPEMSGLDFVKNLREDEWGKTAKIIFLTNLNNTEEVVKAMEYGVEDYIVKSDMKLQDIVMKVQDELEMNQTTSPSQVVPIATSQTPEQDPNINVTPVQQSEQVAQAPAVDPVLQQNAQQAPNQTQVQTTTPSAPPVQSQPADTIQTNQQTNVQQHVEPTNQTPQVTTTPEVNVTPPPQSVQNHNISTVAPTPPVLENPTETTPTAPPVILDPPNFPS